MAVWIRKEAMLLQSYREGVSGNWREHRALKAKAIKKVHKLLEITNIFIILTGVMIM